MNACQVAVTTAIPTPHVQIRTDHSIVHVTQGIQGVELSVQVSIALKNISASFRKSGNLEIQNTFSEILV